MDADLGLANVNVVLGIIPKYNLYHLIRKQKTMREIIMDTNYGIQIVAGRKRLREDREPGRAGAAELHQGALRALCRGRNHHRHVGAGVSANVLSFVAAADEAIIVTTPEPTAITDAYGIIKIIATEIDNLEPLAQAHRQSREKSAPKARRWRSASSILPVSSSI